MNQFIITSRLSISILFTAILFSSAVNAANFIFPPTIVENLKPVRFASSENGGVATVNLSVTANTGTEADVTAVTVTATASDPVSGSQTVNLNVGGTGISAGDYNLSDTTITIPNGSTTGNVTFTVINDTLVEKTETATLTISNPSSGIVLGSTISQNVTITDNEVAYLTFTPTGAVTNENVGTYTSNIRLRIFSGTALQDDVTVGLEPVVFAAATTPGDFSLTTNSVTFPAGSVNNTTQPFNVTIVDDAITEPGEFFDISMIQSTYTGAPIIPFDNSPCGNTNQCRNRQTIQILANNPPITTVVTNTNDSGTGSLRDAVINANSTVTDNIINFNIPSTDSGCIGGICTITLTSGELSLNALSTAGKLTISNSSGTNNLVISGNNASRVFNVNSSSNVTISGLSVKNGNGTGFNSNSGGGILNFGGTLTLTDINISNNSATNGGGIYNFVGSTTSLTNCIVNNNTNPNFGSGGGIYNLNDVNLTMTDSTVSDNISGLSGGGISAFSGTVTIINSTISSNSASQGGGINKQSGGTWTITDSIVSNNTATQDFGGGIVNINGSMAITNSTVNNNAATLNYGGGIVNISAVMTITGSTIRNNTTARQGGGIHNIGTMTVANSTVNDNTAVTGGGIYTTTSLTLTNVTVSGNSMTGINGNTSGGGGGIENAGTLSSTNVSILNNRATNSSCTICAGGFWNFNSSTANLTNTIIAGNTVANASASPDFYGTVSAASSFSILGNDQGAIGITNGVNNNQVGTNANPLNALTTPLGNYGGKTQTHALLSNSPAVNNGTSNASPANDQRGATRIGATDIGAFELNSTTNGGNYVANLPNGRQNSIYNSIISPNNGTFTYTVSNGNLPNGLSLTNNLAAKSEELKTDTLSPSAVVAVSGTPTESGTFNFSVTANDGVNSNVTNYSLLIAALTAANVSVSGRILTNDGRGLQNAIVTMLDQNGSLRSTRSNSFGNFNFEAVEAGQTYTFQIVTKGFTFLPRIVSVNEDLTELNFTSQ